MEENKVNIKDLADEYSHRQGFKSWHSYKKYTTKTGLTVTITDCPGGCGMQQIYAFPCYNQDFEECELLLNTVIKDKSSGVGMIIAQVGATFYNHTFIKVMEKLGFEVLTEYDNLQHSMSGGYKQRVYGLKFSSYETKKQVNV